MEMKILILSNEITKIITRDKELEISKKKNI